MTASLKTGVDYSVVRFPSVKAVRGFTTTEIRASVRGRKVNTND